MGILGNLFSGRPDYPDLDPGSRAASRLAEVETEINKLAEQVNDRMEVVPSEHAAYVFIGKPPKKFGLAWIHDGKISQLNMLIEEHGLTQAEVEKVVEKLRDAYERNGDVERYNAVLHDHEVVVTPSPALEQQVHEIIEAVVRH